MIAVYMRVSSRKQDLQSQEPDLLAAVAGQEHRVYTDTATGKNFDRPGWKQLVADAQAGKVTKVLVWRLDRLGRTVLGMLQVFEELERLGIAFQSLRDGFDPTTPVGRLTCNVLASVAQFETEVRYERVMAGIDARRDKKGRCPWGGRKKGTRITVTEAKEKRVRDLRNHGRSVTEIAKLTKLTRQTVYKVLGRWERSASLDNLSPDISELGQQAADCLSDGGGE